jgi:hypothetical protein
MLVSMSVYCSTQAFVILGIGEYVLPVSITGAQGSFSMWRYVFYSHPELWLNAVNNSVYWVALAYLLREPFGAILLVLAFLFASFLVSPFQVLVGLPGGSTIPPVAIVLGVAGALLCVMETPLEKAQRLWDSAISHLPASWRHSAWARSFGAPAPVAGGQPHFRPLEAELAEKWRAKPVSTPSACARFTSAPSHAPAVDERAPLMATSSDGVSGAHADVATRTRRHASEAAPAGLDGCGGPDYVVGTAAAAKDAQHAGRRCWCDGCVQPGCAHTAEPWLHAGSVLVAFGVLAVTTGIGITLTNWMQERAGLSSFGYTAVDQVLLPFTTLPLVALLERVLWLRRLVGEPRWSVEAEQSPSFLATLKRTWQEVNSTPPSDSAADGARAPTGMHSSRPAGCAGTSANDFSSMAYMGGSEVAVVPVPVLASSALLVTTVHDASVAALRAGDVTEGLSPVEHRRRLPAATSPQPGALVKRQAAVDVQRDTARSDALQAGVASPASGPGRSDALQAGVASPASGLGRSSSPPACDVADTMQRGNPAPSQRGHPQGCSSRLWARLPSWFTRPWPFWFTLAPFHSLEFCRTFIFFWLVTAFDVDSTYLTMTLLRIVLCWFVSLLACTLLQRWVGLTPPEVAVSLHPVNLLSRTAGGVLLVVSILKLKDII